MADAEKLRKADAEKLRKALQDKRRSEGRRKKVVKRVVWADEVGGLLENTISVIYEEEATKTGYGKAYKGEQRDGVNAKVTRGTEREMINGVNAVDPEAKTRKLDFESRWVSNNKSIDESIKPQVPLSETYKEVLLRNTPHQTLHRNSYLGLGSANRRHRRLTSWNTKGRCFRCLASDHKAADRRDPVRCLRCRKTGRRAFKCKEEAQQMEAKRNRALHHRGREPALTVYVPYTEEVLRRRELCRNAILADVIRPAELGRNPITTIKSALARRFGGYSEEFAVARYRERDYAIFLPEWASGEVLVRREVLTLDGFSIRCFPWGQYRNARSHRAPLRAWIRLINLPFECWTVARVAAMVSGFGRFVMVDVTTKEMTDLRAFRCQIALDSLTDIPQNLAVVLGEELVSVLIHLEDWERVVDATNRHHPAPPQIESIYENNQPGWRRADQQAIRQEDNMEEVLGDEAGALDGVHSERSLVRGARQATVQRLTRRERANLDRVAQ